MCGIVGIVNWQGERVDELVLRRMSHKLEHRGPDDSGVWVQGSVGLGHQRLAVIDLSAAGAQPMSSEDGRYQLVFNGEIYNYRELQNQYCQGIKLRSTSDTEVLMRVLMARGEQALVELKGMFALAWWDNQKRELLLARDPMGKKPLYYWQNNQTFVFASEWRAITEHPEVKLAVDKKALVSYLIYEYVPEPATGIAGIKQLPMGSWAKVNAKEINIKQWWETHFMPKISQTETAVEKEFDRLMKQAVKRRLVADVPVGLLLSGGLDSTAVGWYMKNFAKGDLHSFSIGFAESAFDESGYAKQAASVLGTQHHHRDFGLHEFKHYVKRMTEMDVLLADSSLLPTWCVSEMASQEVKVVLDGDGSDELLGGYGVFEAAAWAERGRLLPRGIWQVAEMTSRLLPTKYEYFTLDFKIKSFLRGMGKPRAERQQAWLGSFKPDELMAILTPEFKQLVHDAWQEVSRRTEKFKQLNWWDAMSAQIVRDYLQNDILVKLDRAAMSFGLEARTPFLDVDLVEFLTHLPVKYKRDKWLLKRVMRGRIPDSIIDRPKKGFAMPLGYWLRGELYDWAFDLLSGPEEEGQAVFKTGVAKQLLEDHRAGRADNRKKLWTILALKIWQKKWFS